MRVDTDEPEIIERVAALDVAKAEVVCCARVPGPGRQRMQEVRTVHLFGDELDAVAERLELHRADFLRIRAPLAAPAQRSRAASKPLTSDFVVPPAGFEPATHGLGNRCSIP
jgi:hypothetical protein